MTFFYHLIEFCATYLHTTQKEQFAFMHIEPKKLILQPSDEESETLISGQGNKFLIVINGGDGMMNFFRIVLSVLYMRR